MSRILRLDERTAKVTDPAALARLAQLLGPALARIDAKKKAPAPEKADAQEVRDADARPPEAA
jgi:hypothetical protein